MKTASLLLVVVCLIWCNSTAAGHERPWDDAEVLALEISGELLPPPEVVEQVNADLAAIRAYDPYFETIHVLPAWCPGELLMELTPQAMEDFRAGLYHGLDELNEQYGPVEVREAFENPIFNWLKLTFSRPYNPDLLSDVYVKASGVLYVEPNHIAGDGDDIISGGVGRYSFKHGWGDCPAGCLNERFWVFLITAGDVLLVQEYGADVPVEPTTWGSVKAVYE